MRPSPEVGAFVVVVCVVGLLACSSSDDQASPSSGGTDVTSRAVAPPWSGLSSTAPAASAPSMPTSTSTPTSTPATAAAPPPVEQLEDVRLTLQPFADISRPTAFVTRPADQMIYATSQTGEVWRVAPDGTTVLALDLRAIVTPYEQGSERGLLGLGFSPIDGRLFVYYTDPAAQSHVASYALTPDGLADTGSQWMVMDIPQTGVGHKGGGMSFDGAFLYLALGDGGGSNGRDAQDYSSLLGSIVRIVPRSDGPGYDFPAENPYATDPSKRPELWAKGLRNPWGFYRDPVTGNLWTSDVGNDTMEEIDRLPPGVGGLNFGWYFVEGTQVNHPGAPADAVAPIFAYRHDEVGPAAIGGRVYRGAAIPGLQGAYVFGDLAGATFAIGTGAQTTRLDLAISGVVTGFGEGPDGELYALTHGEGIKKIVRG